MTTSSCLHVCRYIPGEDLYEALEALEQGLTGDSDDNDRMCIQCSKAIAKQLLIVSPSLAAALSASLGAKCCSWNAVLG